jgi:hypothetical protein
MIKLMIKILASHEKYLDRTYGEWIAEWLNWLFSEDPDRIQNSNAVTFLRANIDYEGYGNSRRQTGRHFNHEITISRESAAIFFPVFEAHFYIGHPYYYQPPYPLDEKSMNRLIETDKEMFYLLEEDLKDAKDMKAIINGMEVTPVKTRSPIFTLTVSEKNKIRMKMQQGAVASGKYRTVTGGYWIFAILPSGHHEIYFEGASSELFYSATYNLLVRK